MIEKKFFKHLGSFFQELLSDIALEGVTKILVYFYKILFAVINSTLKIHAEPSHYSVCDKAICPNQYNLIFSQS